MLTDSSQELPFSVCPSVKRSFGAQEEGRGGGGGESSSWVAGGESGGAIYEWTDGAVIIILHWMERLLPLTRLPSSPVHLSSFSSWIVEWKFLSFVKCHSFVCFASGGFMNEGTATPTASSCQRDGSSGGSLIRECV